MVVHGLQGARWDTIHRYAPIAHEEGCRAIFRNESIYPEPETYNPERYLRDGKLDSSVKDPEEMVFGFGRRW